MNLQQVGRKTQIQNIVRDCLQQWALGRSVDELAIVDANLDLAPELGFELRKVRLLGKAATNTEIPNLVDAPTSATDGPSPGLRLRCPHCRNPLEILEDDTAELQCESCGEDVSVAPDSDSTEHGQTKLGVFSLQELLGRGAFGVVWRAYDEELDRHVAIKLPRQSQIAPSQAGQFLREARITAQLAHPNIVNVHEIGRENDTVYIVSELVQGVPLSRQVQPRSTREIATLCETLAKALQHAHEKGVIHRDLKPANIMIDELDQPQIMDFGLAKRDAGEITMTADGQVLGTPAYMSPEQAIGDSHHVDGRSDIYSLGVIMFELLTGELPFRGSVRMLIQQVIHEDPPSPRRLAGNVPKDLETIVLKCLAKEKASRYPSAQAVADDLQRFIVGKPIAARPVSQFQRTVRWGKRNPMAASVLALILLMSVAGPVVAWHEYDQRVKIDGLHHEKLGVIAKLSEKNKELVAELARPSRRFVPTHDNRWSIRTALAAVAVKKYENHSAEQLPRGLIAKANFLAACQRNEEAISHWEQAIRLLESNQGTKEQLTIANCQLRLGELHLAQDGERAVQLIMKAKHSLQDLLNKPPDLATQALFVRSHALLGIAATQTNRRALGLKILTESNRQHAEFLSVLPDAPEDAYEFSHWFFTRSPPLLSRDTHSTP